MVRNVEIPRMKDKYVYAMDLRMSRWSCDNIRNEYMRGRLKVAQVTDESHVTRRVGYDCGSIYEQSKGKEKMHT